MFRYLRVNVFLNRIAFVLSFDFSLFLNSYFQQPNIMLYRVHVLVQDPQTISAVFANHLNGSAWFICVCINEIQTN